MDEKCSKCPVRGYCCYHSIIINGKNVILTNHPCKYLDLKTMTCTIYPKRREINPDCMNIKEAKENGGLPKGCLYITDGERLKNPLKILPSEADFNSEERALYDKINSLTRSELLGKKLD